MTIIFVFGLFNIIRLNQIFYFHFNFILFDSSKFYLLDNIKVSETKKRNRIHI